MRELTQGTRSLIDELLALPKRRFGFVRKRNAAATELLWKIADASEPAALPEVLSFALAEDEPIARAASRAASVLLAAVSTTQLPWLDERLRERATWWGGWWGIGPRELDRFDRFGEGAAALLQLATMHPSGFVREAAVRSLSGRSAAASIPFYLIRRNDWVEQVRTAAVEALDLCARAENAKAIVDALPLVCRLEACTRADHGPFVIRIKGLLGQPESESALRSGIESSDPRVRRYCFTFAFESSSIPPSELLPAGLSDSDPIVRLNAARAAASLRPEAIAELLDQMERDPYTAVRRVGLDVRVSLFPAEAASAYERHLLDRSVSIRSQSQRALRGAPSPPEVLYRDEILTQRTRTLDVALLGLSEVGGAQDAHLVSRFLANELPRVRAAAVRAVSKLATGDTRPTLYAALRDSSPRVSREARIAFVMGKVPADADELWDTVEGAEYRHARINAVSVAQTLPRWARLQFLLRACVNSDELLTERAVLGVSRWLDTSNRAALSPTADDVRETSRLLSDARDWLPKATVSELAFLLRTIG
jgi:HEAT repeat protein